MSYVLSALLFLVASVVAAGLLGWASRLADERGRAERRAPQQQPSI